MVTRMEMCNVCNSRQLHENVNGGWRCRQCRIREEDARREAEQRRQENEIKRQIVQSPPRKR